MSGCNILPVQGAFGAPQAAQQQPAPQYGASMGYGHPSQYYNNAPPYGVNSGYGGGFQQPTTGYSGYGVRPFPTPYAGRLRHHMPSLRVPLNSARRMLCAV